MALPVGGVISVRGSDSELELCVGVEADDTDVKTKSSGWFCDGLDQ